MYRTHEAGFELPAGWIDASVTMLEYDRPGGMLRLGVSRALHGEKDLDASVSERLVEQRRGLAHFELLGRAARTVAGAPAIDVKATHRDTSGTVYQRSLALSTGAKIVTLVASGPEAHRGEVDAIFERATSTLALRPPAAAG